MVASWLLLACVAVGVPEASGDAVGGPVLAASAVDASLASDTAPAVAAGPAGELVAVTLASGRRFAARIDARSSEAALVLRFDLPSGAVYRPVAWSAVRTVQWRGEAFDAEAFRSRWREAATTRSPALTPPSQAGVAPVAAGATDPAEVRRVGFDDADGVADEPAPIVALGIEAWIGHWDADVEIDGLELTIRPRRGDYTLGPVEGTLEVSLVAWTRQTPTRGEPFQVIGRWTRQVVVRDFMGGTATYRLPFQAVHPEFDLSYGPFALVHARLSVPGAGVFDAASSAVHIQPYHAVRDARQDLHGGRYFPGERTGQSRFDRAIYHP